MARRPRSPFDPSGAGAHLLVAAGGVAGAAVRWVVGTVDDPDAWLPWSTLGVNVAGCLLLGLVLAAGPLLRRPAGVGFCGGLTTMSTFAVDTATLADSGSTGRAVLYLGLSAVTGWVAFVGGRALSGTARVR